MLDSFFTIIVLQVYQKLLETDQNRYMPFFFWYPFYFFIPTIYIWLNEKIEFM